MCERMSWNRTWKRNTLMPHEVEPAQPPMNMMKKKNAVETGPQEW